MFSLRPGLLNQKNSEGSARRILNLVDRPAFSMMHGEAASFIYMEVRIGLQILSWLGKYS
jgi:hypothetical protein